MENCDPLLFDPALFVAIGIVVAIGFLAFYCWAMRSKKTSKRKQLKSF